MVKARVYVYGQGFKITTSKHYNESPLFKKKTPTPIVHRFLCKIGSSDSGSLCCNTMQAASGYQHLRTISCAHLHCSAECKEAVIPLKILCLLDCASL